MKKAGDILQHYFSDEQLKTASRYHSLFRSWEEVCGARFVGHSRVRELEQGNLIVEVDHPGWIQMIQLQERRILKKLGNLFPELEITRISLKLTQFNTQIKRGEEKVSSEDKDDEKEPDSMINLVEEFQRRFLSSEKSSES